MTLKGSFRELSLSTVTFEEEEEVIGEMINQVGQLSLDLHEAICNHPLSEGRLVEVTHGPLRIIIMDRRDVEPFTDKEYTTDMFEDYDKLEDS